MISFEAVADGSSCLTKESSQSPTSWVETHWNKQWHRSATVWVGHTLQNSVEFGSILASLCSVGSRRCSSLNKNEVASEPSPFSLARLQEFSQSVLGEINSDLVLMYCMELSTYSIMVMSCSTSNAPTTMVILHKGSELS